MRRLRTRQTDELGFAKRIGHNAEAAVAETSQPSAHAPSLTSHVLTITPFYPRDGNESGGCFIAEPLAEMIRGGLRSTVFAVEPFYRPAPTAISGVPESHWYTYPSLPGGVGLASAGVGLFWRLRGATAELHRQSRIDVIHAHGALPCGHTAFLLSRQLKIPYVISVHGLDAYSSLQVPGWPGEWCRRVSRRVFQGAWRVIGVSQRVCREVEKGWGEASGSVIYNGVDPVLFRPGPECCFPVLLTVGNLISSKGHDLVLRTLATLKSEFPGLIWEVIGDGPELEKLRQLARDLELLGTIRFLGRRNRRAVAEAFRRCTLFVLPSHSEGLGCVYLEAMASGKAAIGCTGQGIEEVIQHRESGWLIPPGGLQELIKAVRTLLQDRDLRARIGNAARQTILNGFTLQHQAQQLMAIYGECPG